MKNIEESNRLIAEFMGARPIVFNNGESGYTFWNEDGKSGRTGMFPDGSSNVSKSDMFGKYHTDWNWLISVVEKIESFKYGGDEISFKISKYAVCLQSLDDDGVIINDCIFSKWATYRNTEKLRAVYDACIEFIKWYNKNK